MSIPTLAERETMQAIMRVFEKRFGKHDEPDTICSIDQATVVREASQDTGFSEASIRVSIEKFIQEGVLFRTSAGLTFDQPLDEDE